MTYYQDSKLLEKLLYKTRARNGCWEWTKTLTVSGYGSKRFTVDKKTKSYLTHRLIWEILFGHPGKKLVCHHCDNRKCINPAHLFLGTYKDNYDDMFKKGRKRSDSVCSGEKNNKNRLKEHQVLEILSYKNKFSSRALATKYLVNKTSILKIWDGRSWSFLTGVKK